MISALTDILTHYRAISQTEREKGTYFEELIRTYFRFEPSYADLYSDVWLYAPGIRGYQGGASAQKIQTVERSWLATKKNCLIL